MNYQRKIFYGRRRDILLGSEDKVKSYIGDILVGSPDSEKELIEKKISEANEGYILILRRVILQAMDMYWVEHLEVMDYMRSSVNLRAYGQRDPLVEYKKEGLILFKNMEFSIRQEILKLIPQIQSAVKFYNAPVKLIETRENAEEITAQSGQNH